MNWQRVEKGIVTGCTISPILFVMCMGMVTTAAERETRGPNIDSGIYQPQISGFLDDLTMTTTSHIQARWVLSALEDSVFWARQRNPDVSYWGRGAWTGKSRCRFKERKLNHINRSKLLKWCLGKWFIESLTDKESIEDTKEKLLSWLLPANHLKRKRQGSTSTGSYQE